MGETHSDHPRPFHLEDHRIKLPQETVTASGPSRGGFYYIPDFITEDEEAYLVQKISTASQPKWKVLQNRSGRELCRLQYWGGQVSKSNVLIPQPMPDFFVKFPNLIEMISGTTAFDSSAHGEPNHCLVNEYLPGQGIMPHEDGGAYFPAVATISLSSHTLLDIYKLVDKSEVPSNPGETNGSDSKEGSEKVRVGDEAVTQPTAVGEDTRLSPSKNEGTTTLPRPGARSREAEPRFSILQEPRSLLITKGHAYREYLHGIAERKQDRPSDLSKVINLDLLGDEVTKDKVRQARGQDSDGKVGREGGGDLVMERDTRLSLTFRDVERVSKGFSGFLSGAVKR
ncbi:hypothetical protein IE53DRAFT_339878 [Violaceomyces palustris]|uniref:Uncharacterized protein n=1 Tax=Violaceomyces palustris TaxID=1673888 RepID=A0ACD0P456_9BASI|nr:hypothetical protein IE53DRAFT_339878 [Violaceomyces palustris]